MKLPVLSYRATEILVRYCAGDLTLIIEIQANDESASSVAQIAGESLGLATEEEVNRKRRREELEIKRLYIDNKKQNQASITDFMNTLELLDPNWKQDARLVTQTKP